MGNLDLIFSKSTIIVGRFNYFRRDCPARYIPYYSAANHTFSRKLTVYSSSVSAVVALYNQCYIINSVTHSKLKLTLAEVTSGLLVALLATFILTAYILGTIGYSINPASVLILALIAVTMTLFWIRRSNYLSTIKLDGWGIFGFAVVVISMFLYVLSLARPSYLPVTQSGDLVNHLLLIDFISQHHTLVHDPSWERYLVEMTVYPPGSHILAALMAAWLNTKSLYILHPLLAFLVAVKAGIIYNIIRRLITPSRCTVGIAIAGTALLLLPYGYFLYSFTAWYFYAMVTAETFLIAALWSLVIWHEHYSKYILAFFTLMESTVLLIWPGCILIPLGVFTLILIFKRDVSPFNKIVWLTAAVFPLVVLSVVYKFGQIASSAGLITNEGTVLLPSINVYSLPLLILSTLGVALSVQVRRTLPIVLFFGATLIQIVVFWWLALNHLSSYYMMYKQFYLLIYPMAICAAVTLDAICHILGNIGSSIWRICWYKLTLFLPILVFIVAIQRGLPLQPLFSPINDQVYKAGLWAKKNIPTGCVDYWVSHWVTAYWLHVDVLGNPRISPRTEDIINVAKFNSRHDFPKYLIVNSSFSFAIIEDVNAIPLSIYSDYKLLYRFGSSAVVQRLNGPICRDETIPF